jgi:hypothetical protein
MNSTIAFVDPSASYPASLPNGRPLAKLGISKRKKGRISAIM